MSRAYRMNPAWVELSLLRRSILVVRLLDPALPIEPMIEASRGVMLAAGWTDTEINKHDQDTADSIVLNPPETAQEIAAKNEREDAERAAEAKVAA